MMRSIGTACAVLILLLAACETRDPDVSSGVAPTGEDIAPTLEEEAAKRSVVWLRDDVEIELANSIRSIFEEEKLLAEYDAFNGSFALELSPAEVLAQLEGADTENDGRFLKAVDHVEPDSVIYPFVFPHVGCGSVSNLTGIATPPNIDRVGGPTTAPANNKVWVIDSGVDKDYAGKQLILNGNLAVSCTRPRSRTCDLFGLNNSDDKWGHGTAIAGIIAGTDDGRLGLKGVSPGASIVPVKILEDENDRTNRFMSRALKGLDYVKGKLGGDAQAGDVVTISWGAKVKYDAPRLTGPIHEYPDQDSVEDAVRVLADAGLRVVIAAGNLMPYSSKADECNPNHPDGHAPGGGYTQTIVPARAGSYRPSGDGGIWTVSAIDHGSDEFWFQETTDRCNDDPDGAGPRLGTLRSPWGSFFGNGLPDFAEPGVSVTTLWITKRDGTPQTAVCTGTSFAVPHLAGILLHTKRPETDGTAEKDPSACLRDATGRCVSYDAARADPIAACERIVDSDCDK